MIIDSRIKAIAWDLDGTIIDSFHIFQVMVTELAPRFSQPVPSEATMAKEFHGTLPESIAAVLPKLSPAELIDFEQQFLNEQEKYYLSIDEHIMADALSLMQQANDAGLKQVIVTNRDHDRRGNASPRYIVEHSALHPLVDHIICGDEVGDYRKPDARVFGNLLVEWGIDSDELLVIGDQHVDALLALNVGAKGLIVIRDGETMAHAHLLPPNWQRHVSEVVSLHEVQIHR